MVKVNYEEKYSLLNFNFKVRIICHHFTYLYIANNSKQTTAIHLTSLVIKYYFYSGNK